MIMQDKNNLQIADLILKWMDERVSKRGGGRSDASAEQNLTGETESHRETTMVLVSELLNPDGAFKAPTIDQPDAPTPKLLTF